MLADGRGWPVARLEDPIRIGAVDVKNRLYRAPLLEVAGNRPDAARILERELAPAADSGAGLIFQGASLVTPTGGRSAPGLSRVHDDAFVASLKPAVDAVRNSGARFLMQLGHGGLQCMELWHHEYRARHPDIETLVVSEPPAWFKLVGRALLDLSSVRVMRDDEFRTLAHAFGQAARRAADAGYDGVHIAGANASIFQQVWSPAFNRRTDAFGGDTIRERSHFFELVVDAIRKATPRDFLLTAKIPAETAAPAFVRHRLRIEDGVEIARVCADLGVDAVAPVQVGVTRDQATARGRFPDIGWNDPRYQNGYQAAFGGKGRASMVKAANRAAALALPFRPAWNEAFCRCVKAAVDTPVLCEGGIRERREMDRILSSGGADMVGMARPFYAEPRIAWRILHEPHMRALCESCNNCTIPQLTGATGVCRTPTILARRGLMQKSGAYGPRP